MKEFKLIDSTFTNEEAKQVLLSLVNYKIQFHSQKVFSNDERFGLDDTFSKSRIVELEEIRDNLLDYFKELGDKELTMKVDSVVNMTIMESVEEENTVDSI